jgi:hypothetical protein
MRKVRSSGDSDLSVGCNGLGSLTSVAFSRWLQGGRPLRPMQLLGEILCISDCWALHSVASKLPPAAPLFRVLAPEIRLPGQRGTYRVGFCLNTREENLVACCLYRAKLREHEQMRFAGCENRQTKC